METFFGEENVWRVGLSVNYWGKIAKQWFSLMKFFHRRFEVDKFIGEVRFLTFWPLGVKIGGLRSNFQGLRVKCKNVSFIKAGEGWGKHLGQMSIFLGGFEGKKFIFSVLLGTYSRKTFEDKKSNGKVIFLPLGGHNRGQK